MFSLSLLFICAFGAATLLPLQSEAVLVSLFSMQQHSALLLISIASIGNVLGSCVNWYLGFYLEHFKNRRWFPVSEKKLAKAQVLYQRYGSVLLLCSWVPIIGDPLTLVAGVLKESFWRFVIIVALAKVLRYLFVYYSYVLTLQTISSAVF